MRGCTNPNAVNYNPLATESDGSCRYLIEDVDTKTEGFSDYAGLEDKSFTVSYSVLGESWVFFHDYLPDFYIHTREYLWSSKDTNVYKNEGGPRGVYYDLTPKSFFIDVVFKSDSDILLETVTWISELLDSNAADAEWSTITHLSIWNSQQHSGRVALKDLFKNLQYETSRKSEGEWSFNEIRNVLATRGSAFLLDFFNDYKLDPAAVGVNPWYEKELLEDKYFVVRFEFDNKVNKELVLHQTNVQATKSIR